MPSARAPAKTSAARLIGALHGLHQRFGQEAAREKLRLLDEIAAARRVSVRSLKLLDDTLDFMRAYPDSALLLARVRRAIAALRGRLERMRDASGADALVNCGFPGSCNAYSYSYEVALRLAQLFPGQLEIEWEELHEDSPLAGLLDLLLAPAENEGAEAVESEWAEWAAHLKGNARQSDLDVILGLLAASRFSPSERAFLYDSCGLTLRYDLAVPGSARSEIELPVARAAFQTRDLERETFPLAPEITRPLAVPPLLGPFAGQALIDLSLRALSARSLEIYPLIKANPEDVLLFRAERGIAIALIGALPEFRGVLAGLYAFLVFKNGAPVAYGPASPFLGACEMGINLFPEFRGGEIRYIYAQVMRLLHHVFAVENFFLTSYGMGRDNEDALRSGAFWFYRKLGFMPVNPKVEALARQEEDRLRAHPGARSDRRTLRRLADTAVSLDLSLGRVRPFDFARLPPAVSRFLARQCGGDRTRALQRCAALVHRALGIPHLRRWTPTQRRALADLAPLLAMLPELPRWSARDKTALRRIVRARGAQSEHLSIRLMAAHPRLGAELRRALE